MPMTKGGMALIKSLERWKRSLSGSPCTQLMLTRTPRRNRLALRARAE